MFKEAIFMGRVYYSDLIELDLKVHQYPETQEWFSESKTYVFIDNSDGYEYYEIK